MSSEPAPTNSDKMVHVEIVDFNKEPVLAQELAEYYQSLDASRATWTPEKLKRLVIRTECKWGRIPVGESHFMLNELAEGPRAPLSKSNTATVKFFAEMRPSSEGAGDGYIEQSPFCRVQFDDESCRKLRAQGLVKLEEFIRRTVPHYAEVVREWQSVILDAREALIAMRKRAQQKKVQEKKPERESAGEGEDQASGGPRI